MKKKSKMGGFSLLGFETLHSNSNKNGVILRRDRHMDEWNRTEKLKIESQRYVN